MPLNRHALTTRMPLPPPPMAALSMTGYSNSLAKAMASSGLAMGWLVPGTTPTPQAMAARLSMD